MPVLRNIGWLVTGTTGAPQSFVKRVAQAALAWQKDKIRWVGAEIELPREFETEITYDAGGRLLVPGLIDCHTHLCFAGWRTDEFVQKIQGKSYLDIAAKGGGIMSTVRATRAASYEALLERARGFLTQMVSLGITTVEAKSGYGLTVEDELKILRVYSALKSSGPATFVSTFLGAHTVPSELKDDRGQYLRVLTEQLLPIIVADKLASFCDIFVERGAFTPDEARVVLGAAKELGLGLKLHVDQLSDGGGGALAAELGAVSADHLEHTSDAGLRAMAAAKVVGVILPIASLYTCEPPVVARRLVELGVRVAIATDFNPGTAPSFHLPLAMNLGCTLNRLTPVEVLNAVTLIAAEALGLAASHGSLEPGKCADFVLIDASSLEDWLYHFLPNSVVATFRHGKQSYGAL